MLKQLFLAACSLAGIVTSSWAEPVSAVTFSGSPALSGTAFYSTRGYEFNVSVAGLKATHLGVFDAASDGLADSHLVGLWTLDGTLLASATVASGTGGLLRDSMRYVDIPDIALDVGAYIVAAVYEEDSADLQANLPFADVSSAPGLTVVRTRYGSCCTPVMLPFPSESLPGGILLGGTLMVEGGTTAVSKPAGHVLAISALAALAFTRRRGAHVGSGVVGARR